MKFITKPILTFLVLILVVIAIFFIEYHKPRLSKTESAGGIYPSAPDFIGISKWINSEPLSIKDLKGKVVLVDFWTYTCVNCIRTLPYLKDWYDKYKENGFVIVGVHTPEFEFEKDYNNVLNAVEKNGIKYPVAQDNEHATWNSYGNRYWPAEYLIDSEGYLRHYHFGEGDYEDTEKLIQKLLKERMEKIKENVSLASVSKPKETIPVDFSKVKSPEIYSGYETTRGNFGNPEGLKAGVQYYKIPSGTNTNYVYLDGKWSGNKDNLELVGDSGKIILEYDSKIANIVAASDKPVDVEVLLDSKIHKKLSVSASQLYLAGEADDYGKHILELDISSPGFKIYTFTFG